MWLITTPYTDTVGGIFVTATVPAVGRFGWTTFSAMERKQVSHSVDTAAGAFTTVGTLKTSLSRATQVLLQSVYSVEHCVITTALRLCAL